MIIFGLLTVPELKRVLKNIEKELIESNELIQESLDYRDKARLKMRYDELSDLRDDIEDYLGIK